MREPIEVYHKEVTDWVLMLPVSADRELPRDNYPENSLDRALLIDHGKIH